MAIDDVCVLWNTEKPIRVRNDFLYSFRPLTPRSLILPCAYREENLIRENADEHEHEHDEDEE